MMESAASFLLVATIVVKNLSISSQYIEPIHTYRIHRIYPFLQNKWNMCVRCFYFHLVLWILCLACGCLLVPQKQQHGFSSNCCFMSRPDVSFCCTHVLHLKPAHGHTQSRGSILFLSLCVGGNINILGEGDHGGVLLHSQTVFYYENYCAV